MNIRTDNLPWPIDLKLQALLQEELARAKLPPETGAIATLRDPDFSADSGGYHPVEIAVTHDGTIIYITDFAYFGRPPHCELAKELDFDFAMGLFQHFGVEYLISEGHELYKLWQSNFLAYHRGGAYTVTVEPMRE